jgi:hypothetical protein
VHFALAATHAVRKRTHKLSTILPFFTTFRTFFSNDLPARGFAMGETKVGTDTFLLSAAVSVSDIWIRGGRITERIGEKQKGWLPNPVCQIAERTVFLDSFTKRMLTDYDHSLLLSIIDYLKSIECESSNAVWTEEAIRSIQYEPIWDLRNRRSFNVNPRTESESFQRATKPLLSIYSDVGSNGCVHA